VGNPLLSIKSLNVNAGAKLILKGLNLEVNQGETHVILGHNGAGKSTLAAAIMGNPAFSVTDGSIIFDGVDITELSPDKRAKLGIFLSFQSPEEISGISLENFLRTSIGALRGEMPKLFRFQKELYSIMDQIGLDKSYAARDLNVGFSGGEKKKTEILQLLLINPKLAILDEPDSGLDVDAVRVVSGGLQRYLEKGGTLIIITHNQKLVDEIDVNYVHVIDGKQISVTGAKDLIAKVADSGFKAVNEETAP